MSKKKDLSAALLGVAVALIMWVTILSREAMTGTPIVYHLFHTPVSFLKEVQRGRMSVNFFGNIILFMPVGFLVPIVTDWRKKWKIVVAGIVFSLFIETIQFVTSRGCFDPDDVILNGLGTLIGLEIFRAVGKLFIKNELEAKDNGF